MLSAKEFANEYGIDEHQVRLSRHLTDLSAGICQQLENQNMSREDLAAKLEWDVSDVDRLLSEAFIPTLQEIIQIEVILNTHLLKIEYEQTAKPRRRRD